jgi:hypothetical protein
MTTGIFTLAGVVVGGLLTGGVTYWLSVLERRRELRRVRRLLMSELATAWTHLTIVLNRGQGEAMARVREERAEEWLPVSAWREHKATLAGSSVGESEWRALDGIYDELDAIRRGMFAGVEFLTVDIEDLRKNIWDALELGGRVERQMGSSEIAVVGPKR